MSEIFLLHFFIFVLFPFQSLGMLTWPKPTQKLKCEDRDLERRISNMMVVLAAALAAVLRTYTG